MGMDNTRAKILSMDAEVLRFCRWKIWSEPVLERMAMTLGGYDEVINMVWIAVERSKSKMGHLNWMTAAGNQLRWCCLSGLKRRVNRPFSAEDFERLGMYDLRGDSCSDDQIRSAQLSELRKRMAKVLQGQLSWREQQIVDMRFGISNGDPMGLAEVGKELKVSRERIRQIECVAIRKLSNPFCSGQLVGFVD
jgi:RNA polymerase sigma factor (sigma-70 family)